MFTHKKKRTKKKTRGPAGDKETVLPLIEVVLLCTCVSFSIFILKVCYLKGHLLEKGEVMDEEK